MRSTTLVRIAVLNLVIHGIGAGAQTQETLIDIARTHGGTTTASLHVDLPFSTLAEIVERSSVVVRAQIHRKEARLTRDGRFVRTHYSFTPTKVFKDTVGIGLTRRTPQATVPLTFADIGGILKIDGLEIRQTSNVSVAPFVNVGDEVVLLLEWDKSAQEFLLQNGSYGLLRVKGDIVTEVTEVKKRGIDGKRASEIEAEIQQLVQGGRSGNDLGKKRRANGRQLAF